METESNRWLSGSRSSGEPSTANQRCPPPEVRSLTANATTESATLASDQVKSEERLTNEPGVSATLNPDAVGDTLLNDGVVMTPPNMVGPRCRWPSGSFYSNGSARVGSPAQLGSCRTTHR